MPPLEPFAELAQRGLLSGYWVNQEVGTDGLNHLQVALVTKNALHWTPEADIYSQLHQVLAPYTSLGFKINHISLYDQQVAHRRKHWKNQIGYCSAKDGEKKGQVLNHIHLEPPPEENDIDLAVINMIDSGATMRDIKERYPVYYSRHFARLERYKRRVVGMRTDPDIGVWRNADVVPKDEVVDQIQAKKKAKTVPIPDPRAVQAAAQLTARFGKSLSTLSLEDWQCAQKEGIWYPYSPEYMRQVEKMMLEYDA